MVISPHVALLHLLLNDLVLEDANLLLVVARHVLQLLLVLVDHLQNTIS